MIMKWEDLEPGDVIRATGRFKEYFINEVWAKIDLPISSFVVSQKFAHKFYILQCLNNRFYFTLSEDGCHRSWEDLGPAFEIVSLKEE